MLSTCQNELPDYALIQRFQAGESRVFDQFYCRHFDRIRTMISNPEDTSDLTALPLIVAYCSDMAAISGRIAFTSSSQPIEKKSNL